MDVPASSRALRAHRVPFETIEPTTWDALAAATPWATPFATWAFHRAWWDAYGSNAHDHTMVAVDEAGAAAGDGRPAIDGHPLVAIVPLMHRHEVEPGDAAVHTTLRHGSEVPLTPVAPWARAIFFGASYHADYATVLADPADMPAVASAVADALAGEAWDAIDLRRLRCGDPAADALAAAFGGREMASGWTVNLEREDVCPVAVVPEGADYEGFLATLDKKERHEIRRKVRRAEAAGLVELREAADPLADLPAFIDLHQRRWGADGLFPDTPGGDQSRRFLRRLLELLGPEGPLRLSFLEVGGRRIAAGLHFQTADGFLYYNAGVDPDARDLSPGVVMIARYLERLIGSGRRRMDFLRGNEPYKYEWGATDEPIQRLLVRRTSRMDGPA
jgi:CelD/BcsL family acetyltransferase involved in cellulose biosynthesis